MVNVTIDSSPQHFAFFTDRLYCQTTTLTHREDVGTILMVIFGITWLGREPMTYHMRGEQAHI